MNDDARTGPPAPIKTPCIKVCVVDGLAVTMLGSRDLLRLSPGEATL